MAQLYARLLQCYRFEGKLRREFHLRRDKLTNEIHIEFYRSLSSIERFGQVLAIGFGIGTGLLLLAFILVLLLR